MLKSVPIFLLNAICIVVLNSYGICYSDTKVDNTGDDYKIIYNKSDMGKDINVKLIDKKVYIDISQAAKLFNLKIEFDDKSKTFNIYDEKSYEISELKKDQAAKNDEIAKLKAKLSELEAKTNLTTGESLDELEGRINRDYSSYEDVSFTTFISGDENEILLRIYPDVKNNSKAWGDLTGAQKKDLIKAIIEEIAEYFPEVEIKGYIRDVDKRDNTMNFHTDGKMDIKYGSFKFINTLRQLEEEINDDFNNRLNGIDICTELSGNKNKVEFKLNYINSMYAKEWEKVNDKRVKAYMKDICSYINKKLNCYNVKGVIYDVENNLEAAVYINNNKEESFEILQ